MGRRLTKGLRAGAALFLSAWTTWAAAGTSLNVEVAAEPGHIAWDAAGSWRDSIAQGAHRIDVTQLRGVGNGSGEVSVVPLHRLAQTVPSASVLELPFLFRTEADVERAVASSLGDTIREEASAAGLRVLAVWNEGMHSLSGNGRYDRAENLVGIEFVVLRPDPIAERQFTALDAWTRVLRPQSLSQLMTECLVSSRSATLQQIAREQLFRVHLSLTLTQHRYEGWAVLAKKETWDALPESARIEYIAALEKATGWQRREAAIREERALARLKAEGMAVFPLDDAGRRRYQARMQPWEDMLPSSLTLDRRRDLIRMATTAGGT